MKRPHPLLMLASTLAGIVTLATLSFGPSSQASGSALNLSGADREVYFFSSPSDVVAINGKLSDRNRFVVRPEGFPLFLDGKWVLEKLNWTGWGSQVAKASGLSSTSDGIPNVAEGKRTVTWAKVRLSQLGKFHGHRIYRCIRITVPPPANYGGPRCLQRQHRAIILASPGSGEPVGVAGKSRGSKRKNIPTTRRNAIFRPSCDSSHRCVGEVKIARGGMVLASGRYSVPAHSSPKVAIPLTRSGRKALSQHDRIRAKLTIVDLDTRKREVLAVNLTR